MLKSIFTGLIVLSFIVISTVFFPSQAVTATPVDNPQCDGLTGAAFGLCAAATAVGCDGSDTQAPGCTQIAEQFTQITGETPPWTLPPCPCGTANDFVAYLDTGGGVQACGDVTRQYLEIKSIFTSVFSYYPGQFGSKQTCGFDNTSLYSLTNDEAQSCITELNSIITQYDLTCEVF
jgi:hypothetical protein